MIPLRQSTQTIVRIGPFVDVADGLTPEVTVTLTGGGDPADEAELLKAGGIATVDISARTWAAISDSDGWYNLTLTTTDLDTIGDITVVIQNDSEHLPVHVRFQVIAQEIYDAIYKDGATGFDENGKVSLSPNEDVYHADIDLTIDTTNTKDEYTATWFKNGVRLTSGIITPTIRVIKRIDGTDLIATQAMTQIGTTGSYKFDAEIPNRIIGGDAVLVVVSATIDSGARSFVRLRSRDS